MNTYALIQTRKNLFKKLYEEQTTKNPNNEKILRYQRKINKINKKLEKIKE